MEEKVNFINYLDNVLNNYFNELVSLGYDRADFAKKLYAQLLNDSFDFSEFGDTKKYKNIDLKRSLESYMYAVYYMFNYYSNSLKFADDIMCELLNSFNVFNPFIKESFLIEEVGLNITNTLVNYLMCSDFEKKSMAKKMEQDENFDDALECNHMLSILYQVNRNLPVNEKNIVNLNDDVLFSTNGDYNADIIEVFVAQEKLNEICFASSNLMYPIRNIVSKIKSDEKSKYKMIDIIYASYLVDNYNSLDKNRSGICNFIMNFSNNKELLYSNFIENTGMANELASSFYRGYNEGVCVDYETIPDAKIKLKALGISPIFNCLAFNYLTDITRAALFDLLNSAIFQNHNYSSMTISILKIINETTLKKVLVGDAYTYMCYNNFDKSYDDYISKIEKNCGDFNKIWCFLDEDYTHLYNFILYASNLCSSVDEYSEVYKKVSLINPNFLSTIKKVNPFYIMDEIRDYNVKKYRK